MACGGAKVEVCRLALLKKAAVDRGVRPELAEKIYQYNSTEQSYQSHWKTFVLWCAENHVDALKPTDAQLVEFLDWRWTTCGVSSETVSGDKAVILSTYKSLGIEPYASQKSFVPPLVTKLIKEMGKTKPVLPKYLEYPDLLPCLALVKGWDNSQVPEDKIRAKSLFLLRMVLHARSADVSKISRQNLVWNAEGVRMVLMGTKENVVRGTPVSIARCEDRDLCPVEALYSYVTRFLQDANGIWKWNIPFVFQQLSASYERPQSLKSSGCAYIIQTYIFQPVGVTATADCIRGFSATRALGFGVPMEEVMKDGRWKSMEVFLRHYGRKPNQLKI